MGGNKRNFARLPVPMKIEARIDEADVIVLETVDISDGGAFIKAEPHQCPVVGTELSLKVMGRLTGETPPTVQARVVRITDRGIGVEFLSS